MLPDIFKPERLGSNFKELKESVQNGKNTSVFYATQNARYHISWGLDKFFLYVTPDSLSAKAAHNALQEYMGSDVVFIPEKDEVLLNVEAYYGESLNQRLTAIGALNDQTAKAAVCSAEALMQYLPLKSLYQNSVIKLQKGGFYDQTLLVDQLVAMGYKKQDSDLEPFCFSLRGDTVDVFAQGNDLPVRIEFFGDEIQSMRLFAPDSMMRIKEIDSVTIRPKYDIILTPKLKEGIQKSLTSLSRHALGKFSELLLEMQEKLSQNIASSWFIPFMHDGLATIFDYIPTDSIIVFDEIKAIDDKLKLLTNAHSLRLKSFIENGQASALHKNSIIPREIIFEKALSFTILNFQLTTSANPIFDPKAIFNIKSLAVTKYYMNNQALITDVNNMLVNGAKIYIYAGNQNAAKALSDFFFENSLAADISEDENTNNGLLILPKRISKGFIYPKEKLALFGTDDVIKKTAEVTKKTLQRKRAAFLTPEKGDYVVHEKHGIGIFDGIVQMNVENGKRDYYSVLYKGGDKLFLPVDQIDKLEKYTGGGTPVLHRIGGKEFERLKERVKQSVKKLAVDLLSLYEKRLNTKGHKYQPDTIWQQEMEDSFEYTETDDQLTAIAEIKEDMEKGKLMDRLLSGDVGFGKTEVAMRAIFKTIIEGKQAALLAPTTILCTQHYNTISQRLKPFGITVDVLSRFMPNDYIKAALERIKNGKTSIVVATHRLLSADVSFYDLGLLVLDEEQRFGVEHKEKIKLLKSNVNVLSLSATPIPRTLHMALSGIRDISTLETPPKNRLPVQTYVVEYSDALLIDAVKKELSRGGQVFILYNRVATITTFYQYVCGLIGGEANVIYAHGQMDSDDLEQRIRMFYNKEADVLISTTIIENGIDLPDANTLIVLDSDRLGLSEMYQLRGRVGRSHNLAYAYFTVKEGKVLTADAQKRLEAIVTHTALGSGFKIAMEDLEIRGAGNVLGREQHGNMEKVGYDMYCKLLNDSIDELRGKPKHTLLDVEIVVSDDALLPESYIPNSNHRVRFYKEVAALDNSYELEQLLARLIEGYGQPPQSVVNLVNIGLVKNLAIRLGVKRINITKLDLSLTFYSSTMFKDENIFKALGDFKDIALLLPSDTPQIVFNADKLTFNKKIAIIRSFLEVSTNSPSNI